MPDVQGSVKIRRIYRKQKVLVTGGFGFIGSHLCAELLRCGARVTVVDLFTDPTRESLLNLEDGRLRANLQVVQGDTADAPFVRDLIARGQFRYIFNLASGATVIERAVADPIRTVESNTMALVHLLEAVRGLAEPPQAVFQASTDKVYGDASGEPYDEERTPLQSVGLYDCSKLAADVLARAWFSVFGVPTVVLRLCNIFGPWDFNSGFRLVPRALKALFGSTPPQPPELYFESIDHRRDYLYIDDCVQAILLLTASPQAQGQAFNLPGCCHLSTPEMCRAIVDAAVEVERQYDPDRAAILRKNGVTLKLTHQPAGVIAIKVQRSTGEKLHRTTGFVPRSSLPEALVRTAELSRDYYLGRVFARPASMGPSPSPHEPASRLVA